VTLARWWRTRRDHPRRRCQPGDDSDVEAGNVRLAQDVVNAVIAASRPVRVVYANSIQAGNGTAYGTGKEQAATLLRGLEETGSVVVDVRLPNIFGEHGRPGYNSFVATFVHAVASGGLLRSPTALSTCCTRSRQRKR
jgi:UDP-2-acetamido-2,6-beta-L-arabino-hexul-4-ose reductase